MSSRTCWPSQAGLSVLHVSPFLRKFAKLPPLNLQDTPYLAFFLTQSCLRSRRVIPVLQRVLISLRRAARFPAVHPTAAVFHRCRSARLSSALRSSPAARAEMQWSSDHGRPIPRVRAHSTRTCGGWHNEEYGEYAPMKYCSSLGNLDDRQVFNQPRLRD